MKPALALLALALVAVACSDPAPAPRHPDPQILFRFQHNGVNYSLANGDSGNTWPPEVIQGLKLALEGTGQFDSILASPQAREALQRGKPR